MAMIVLTLHLIVCICLIGLVLLQRSEGGALGVGGGGGGGALMSGRGAADALAKMTTLAGGVFLATSLILTVLAGAGRDRGSSVFDSAPALPAITAPAPADPVETTPDPTESNAIQAAPDAQLAAAPAQASPISLGPPAAAAATAGPLPRTETPAPAATTRTAAPGAPVTTAAPRTNQAQVQQTNAPTNVQPRPQPIVIPNTSGAAGAEVNSGVAADFTDESSQGVQPVRRERAGPDQ